jgi:branched-chain amino acid transport system substrate-binding protein
MKSLLLCLALMLLVSCVQGNVVHTEQDPIKIGIINTLTTPVADYGVPSFRASEIAVEEINARGGINGRQIQIFVEDGRCNSVDSTKAAHKLINIDGVDAIITGCSTETLAVAPIAEESGILVMASLSTSPAVSNAGNFIFRTAPPNQRGIELLAEEIYAMGFESVGMLYELRAYPEGMKDTFLQHYAGDIVVTESFGVDQNDFSTSLLKIKTSEVDAMVLFVQAHATSIDILEQIQTLGLDLPLVTNEVVADPRVLNESGYSNQVITIEVIFDEAMPASQRLVDMYEQKFSEDAKWPIYMATSYDAVSLVSEALGACDDDSVCAKNYLDNIVDWPGVAGNITFDSNGDPLYEYELIIR